MAIKTCSLLGCNNPCADAPPDRLACGELHHLLLMAGRFNPSLPHPHELILHRNSLGLCALPLCNRSPWHPHPWCLRKHYLSWLSDFYAHLSPQQICKLPDCTRHVFVHDSTDGGCPTEFCGWRHRQKFAMRNALKRQQDPESPHAQEDHGYVPSLKSLLHDLKQFELYGVIPKSTKVDKDFFDKHPWDILGDAVTCFVIARCKLTQKKQRIRVTKGHHRWRQQGPTTEKCGYTSKYLTYVKCKGKKKVADEHNEESLYTMMEYSVKDCELYCLVQLRKGVSRRRKGEVDNGFSQDNVLPESDDWDYQFPESFEELAPLDSIIMQDLPDLSEDFSP